MADLLSIGRSGLTASRTQLTTTGHNISNVDTPGYSRQIVTKVANSTREANTGYVGAGTSAVSVRRAYSEYLTTQVRTSTTKNSQAVAFQSQVETLDSLLADSTTGISSSLDSFFTSLQTASTDPANTTTRQLVLSDAEALAQRFNSLNATMSEQNSLINKEIRAIGSQINGLAQTIGKLNESIATAGSNGELPNELLDSRDEAIRELSSYIGVSVVQQDDSTLNVFIGNGQPLVVGEKVNALEVSRDADDPTQVEINFVNETSKRAITAQLNGGALGGLIDYRDTVLIPSQNTLGQMALAFSDSVNTQLSQGVDLNGNSGAALFADINDEVLMSQRVTPSSYNNSEIDGSLQITSTANLVASDYQLRFDGANYTALRSSDGAVIQVTQVTQDNQGVLTFADSLGQDQGFSVTLTGAPIAGDSFTLLPTRQGAGDIQAILTQPDQLALAAPLRSDASAQNSGTGSIGQPTITASTDTSIPGKTNVDHVNELISISPISWTYLNDGAFSYSLPQGVPDGWTVNVTPDSILVGAEESTFKFSVEVNDGYSKTSYTLTQRFEGAPKVGDTFDIYVASSLDGVSSTKNAGSATLSTPIMVSITDNIDPTQNAVDNLSKLASIEGINWTYASVSVNGAIESTLSPSASSIPDGWAVSFVPDSISVQDGEFEYGVRIDDGVSTTVYIMRQGLYGSPESGDAYETGFLNTLSRETNTGSGGFSGLEVSSVVDIPKNTELDSEDLKAVSPLSIVYQEDGSLSLTIPELPDGWSAKVTPESIVIDPGKSNDLTYRLEISTGTTTTSYDIQQSFSGIPKEGDSFTVSFNSQGVGDGRNAQALVDLQDKQVLGVTRSSSGYSLSDAYGNMVESVGTATAVARQEVEVTGAVLTQATDSRNSLSGVDLDEEAANLIKFEQYYNASAQVIQVARSMFDTLLAAFR